MKEQKRDRHLEARSQSRFCSLRLEVEFLLGGLGRLLHSRNGEIRTASNRVELERGGKMEKHFENPMKYDG